MGRPPKGKRTLTRATIISGALDQLHSQGSAGLTFKALAAHFGVTPMAIAHHVGSREEMISDIIDAVFDHPPLAPEGDAPKARLRKLMMDYCDRLIAYPDLPQLILQNVDTMGKRLRRISQAIDTEIMAMGLSPQEAKTALGVLVDYTHGFAVSADADSAQQLGLTDYEQGLDWILQRLTPSAQ